MLGHGLYITQTLVQPVYLGNSQHGSMTMLGHCLYITQTLVQPL